MGRSSGGGGSNRDGDGYHLMTRLVVGADRYRTGAGIVQLFFLRVLHLSVIMDGDVRHDKLVAQLGLF